MADLPLSGNGFQALVTQLAKKQVEFDLGSEAVITELGTIGELDGTPVLQVGECAYTAVGHTRRNGKPQPCRVRPANHLYGKGRHHIFLCCIGTTRLH